jgi:hypothetical protein
VGGLTSMASKRLICFRLQAKGQSPTEHTRPN